MRLCYLRIALLTSAIASNAVTVTAETDVESTTSSTASSLPFVRDNLAASVVGDTQSEDGEDRGGMKILEFAHMFRRSPQSDVFTGIKTQVFVKYIRKGMTPKYVYDLLDLSNLNYEFLSHDRWICWIYFLCQLSRYFEENEYKFIIAAMSVTHNPVALYNKLLSALEKEKTKPFAINLIKVASDEIKGQVLEQMPWLESEVTVQKKHPAEAFYGTLRDRIDAYLKKRFIITYGGRSTSKLDNSDKMKFSVLTSYLSVLFSEDHAVSTGQIGAHKHSKDAALLTFLLSLDKFDDQDYIRSLVSIYLDVNLPPSEIVSMLVQDVPKADQFAILFWNKPSRRFWLHYLEMYKEPNDGINLMHAASFNFEQLLDTLLDVAINTDVPESAFIETAISTWLKVLTLPQHAHLQKSQIFLHNLMLIWRDGGILPSKIVSALKFDEAKNKQFTILFLNEWSRSFWVRYFEQYIQKNHYNVESMQSANVELKELVETLFGVAKQETPAADKYVAYRTILKLLLSPYSTHLSSKHEHVIELMPTLLLDRTLPSDVLSMLMHGEADADKFNILFVDKSSKSFWVRYLKLYFECSFFVEDFAGIANVDFQQLLIMLHAVGVQELATAGESRVVSTILKLLVSPEIATILDPRFSEEMVSACLNHEVTPSNVVSMLVFEEEEADYFQILFENMLSSKLWEDYTTAYYSDPSPQLNHMMLTLVRAIGDANLERILNAAIAVEATSEKAKALLTQVALWKHTPPS